MLAQGWQLGTPQGYNRETALYEQDVLDFVQQTQSQDWQKFQRIFPQEPNGIFWKPWLPS
ncbi:putative type I restriction enzyme [Acinetobacter baumannii 1267820]|nr:putative type I restriction enzyme [Acinetobacter baumannii 1267820]